MKRQCRGKIAVTLGLMAMLLSPGVCATEVWGLVIGINDYRHLPKLEGAVNDAMDIAAALRELNAREVRLLLDGDATRDAILANWRELTQKAAPGDTLIVAYAGHGGQEAQHIPNSEADKQDEVLLLGGFKHKAPANYERILDNEIAALLQPADHITVLLIADACHSGTVVRGLDSRVRRFKTRYAPYGPIEDDTLPPPFDTPLDDLPLRHVVHFAAVADHELAPEIEIEGKIRGALSWATANGLRGKADRDGNGVITRGELERYVRENIRMRHETRQHPQVVSAAPLEQPLVRVAKSIATETPTTVLPLPRLRVAIVSKETRALRRTAPTLAAAKAMVARLFGEVADKNDADLLWDPKTGEILSRYGGDVVARMVGATHSSAQEYLKGVVDKWSLVERLKVIAERYALVMTLKPDDSLHAEGKELTLTVSGSLSPYLTVFNLAADGRINFLYPIAALGDSLKWPQIGSYDLDLIVEPPFGADHIVAIATEQPLTSLHGKLHQLDGKSHPLELAQTLHEILASQRRVEIGVHTIYTLSSNLP